MNWNPVGWEDLGEGGNPTTQGVSPNDEKDLMGFAKLGGLLGEPKPFTKELMRAAFWCPPHPPEVEVTDENVPYMQVYKKYQPDVWTPELRQWTMPLADGRNKTSIAILSKTNQNVIISINRF